MYDVRKTELVSLILQQDKQSGHIGGRQKLHQQLTPFSTVTTHHDHDHHVDCLCTFSHKVQNTSHMRY